MTPYLFLGNYVIVGGSDNDIHRLHWVLIDKKMGYMDYDYIENYR